MTIRAAQVQKNTASHFNPTASLHNPGMVRPRASKRNLQVAILFADIVVIQAEHGYAGFTAATLVERKGGRSIFAAFAECFPELARFSHEERPKNRSGVTSVELNKALQTNGLKPWRRREKKGGGVQWGSKVGNTLDFLMHLTDLIYGQNWTDCRWINPSDPKDLALMSEKLVRARRFYEEFNRCTIEHLQRAVSRSLNLTMELSNEGAESHSRNASDQTALRPDGMKLRSQGFSSAADLGRLLTISGLGPPTAFQQKLLPNAVRYDFRATASFGCLCTLSRATQFVNSVPGRPLRRLRHLCPFCPPMRICVSPACRPCTCPRNPTPPTAPTAEATPAAHMRAPNRH